MRGQVLAVVLLGVGAPAAAQGDPGPTAEEIIATAREFYSVREREPEPEPCPEATNAEIVVCRQYRNLEDEPGILSPTERANAAGDRPPDPRPDSPYILGLPECKVEVVCHRVGRAPPPIYIIDLEAIPEPLTPEEAALVVRAEDEPSPEAASPAAAP